MKDSEAKLAVNLPGCKEYDLTDNTASVHVDKHLLGQVGGSTCSDSLFLFGSDEFVFASNEDTDG